MPNSNYKIDFLTEYFLSYFKYKYLKIIYEKIVNI